MSQVTYAAPIAPASSVSPIVPGIQTIIQDPARVSIPFEHATLKEVHRGNSGKLIIHIQDAHANYSGQMSLAHTLDQLMTRYAISLVLSEGSAADSTLDNVKRMASAKDWKIAAKQLMLDGIIKGEEYVNLTTDHPMQIRGIEYRELYDKSLEAYAGLVDKRKDILLYLYKIRTSLQRLKNRHYPKKLLDYENGRGILNREAAKPASPAGGDRTENMKDLLLLSDQAGIDLGTHYPETSKLKNLQHQEKAIDFVLANHEQSELLKALSSKGKAAKSKVQAFIKASKKAGNSQIAHFSLLNNMLGLAEGHRLSPKKYPALLRYREYLKDFTDLKMDVLLDELDQLEDEVYKSILIQSEDARRLRAIDRYIGLLDQAYRIRMSSDNFQMFLANEKDFRTEGWEAFLNEKLKDLDYFEDLIPYKSFLEDARDSLQRFYALVDERDLAFLENANRIMKEEDQDIVFLIAGGYHTAHLTELLRRSGSSYIVLTPAVTMETDHEKYEERLLEPLARLQKQNSLAKSDHTESASKTTLREILLRSGHDLPEAAVKAILKGRLAPQGHEIIAELSEAPQKLNDAERLASPVPSAARLADMKEQLNNERQERIRELIKEKKEKIKAHKKIISRQWAFYNREGGTIGSTWWYDLKADERQRQIKIRELLDEIFQLEKLSDAARLAKTDAELSEAFLNRLDEDRQLIPFSPDPKSVRSAVSNLITTLENSQSAYPRTTGAILTELGQADSDSLRWYIVNLANEIIDEMNLSPAASSSRAVPTTGELLAAEIEKAIRRMQASEIHESDPLLLSRTLTSIEKFIVDASLSTREEGAAYYDVILSAFEEFDKLQVKFDEPPLDNLLALALIRGYWNNPVYLQELVDTGAIEKETEDLLYKFLATWDFVGNDAIGLKEIGNVISDRETMNMLVFQLQLNSSALAKLRPALHNGLVDFTSDLIAASEGHSDNLKDALTVQSGLNVSVHAAARLAKGEDWESMKMAAYLKFEKAREISREASRNLRYAEEKVQEIENKIGALVKKKDGFIRNARLGWLQRRLTVWKETRSSLTNEKSNADHDYRTADNEYNEVLEGGQGARMAATQEELNRETAAAMEAIDRGEEPANARKYIKVAPTGILLASTSHKEQRYRPGNPLVTWVVRADGTLKDETYRRVTLDEARDELSKNAHNAWRAGVIAKAHETVLDQDEKLVTPRGRNSENPDWDNEKKSEISAGQYMDVTENLTDQKLNALNGGKLLKMNDGAYLIQNQDGSVQLDTLNTPYDSLSPAWKAKNLAAIEAAIKYYEDALSRGYDVKTVQAELAKAINRGKNGDKLDDNYVDGDTLKQFIVDIGDREHVRWMKANDWMKDNEPHLFVEFAQLPAEQQYKDLEGFKQLADYMGADPVVDEETVILSNGDVKYDSGHPLAGQKVRGKYHDDGTFTIDQAHGPDILQNEYLSNVDFVTNPTNYGITPTTTWQYGSKTTPNYVIQIDPDAKENFVITTKKGRPINLEGGDYVVINTRKGKADGMQGVQAAQFKATYVDYADYMAQLGDGGRLAEEEPEESNLRDLTYVAERAATLYRLWQNPDNLGEIKFPDEKTKEAHILSMRKLFEDHDMLLDDLIDQNEKDRNIDELYKAIHAIDSLIVSSRRSETLTFDEDKLEEYQGKIQSALARIIAEEDGARLAEDEDLGETQILVNDLALTSNFDGETVRVEVLRKGGVDQMPFWASTLSPKRFKSITDLSRAWTSPATVNIEPVHVSLAAMRQAASHDGVQVGNLPMGQVTRSFGTALTRLEEHYETVIAVNPATYEALTDAFEAFGDRFEKKVLKVSDNHYTVHIVPYSQNRSELETLYPNADAIAVIDEKRTLETLGDDERGGLTGLGLISTKTEPNKVARLGIIVTFMSNLMLERARAQRAGELFDAREFLRNDRIARQLFRHLSQTKRADLVKALQSVENPAQDLSIIIENTVDPSITPADLQKEFLTILESSWTA